MDKLQQKKVVIVIRGLSKGGVFRAIEHLVEGIDNEKTPLQITILTNEKHFLHKEYSRIKVECVNIKSKLIFDWIISLWKIFKLSPDIILYTKNVIPITHGLIPAKKAIIVHDLGYFEKGLGAYKPLDTLFMRTFMKISARWSSVIFTVSHFSKSRVEILFGIPSHKIITAHLSLDNSFKVKPTPEEQSRTKDSLNIKEPFLFYAGSISPRKNLVRLVQAFASLTEEIPHHLYITGLKSWGDESELSRLITKYSDRIHVLGYVSDQDLKVLYTLSDIYLFPSLYEGFGLPILEAQSQGTPVITSNQNSCAEVAQDSALLIDPTSIDDIKNAIINILNSPALAEELSKRGFKNISRFSWNESANIIIQSLIK